MASMRIQSANKKEQRENKVRCLNERKLWEKDGRENISFSDRCCFVCWRTERSSHEITIIDASDVRAYVCVCVWVRAHCEALSIHIMYIRHGRCFNGNRYITFRTHIDLVEAADEDEALEKSNRMHHHSTATKKIILGHWTYSAKIKHAPQSWEIL